MNSGGRVVRLRPRPVLSGAGPFRTVFADGSRRSIGNGTRNVDQYEYQGRELFARHGLPVLDGGVATTPAEARAIAERLGGQVVVKAQVKVGGRGKAGGVKLANGVDEAE